MNNVLALLLLAAVTVFWMVLRGVDNVLALLLLAAVTVFWMVLKDG
jgi:hypothetical protein